MGRIRSIKPEFPQSETIGSLSRDARLLFIQLWTLADDLGRARASSRVLASLLYPFDDDAKDLIDGWLNELESRGCIRRYSVEGNHYLDIPNWLKHQRIDHPGKSHFPEYSRDSREPSRALAPDLGSRILDLGKKESCAVAVATRTKLDEGFQDFWKVYPKRKGANPRKTALDAYRAKVKAGAIPSDILAGARRCAEKDADKIGTEYIPQAVKWLRDERWRDYLEESETAPVSNRTGVYVEFTDPAREAWDAYGRSIGKQYPVDKRGGWEFPTRWPPGYDEGSENQMRSPQPVHSS